MVNERKQKLVRMGAILFTLLISALLCARGATQILASSLLPVQEKPAPKPVRRQARNLAEEREQSPQELAQAVLTRNIFDSQTGSMEWDAPVEETIPSELPSEMVRDPDGEPSLCQGALRLVASFVVPRVPALSFASIEAAGKTMLYRSGMQVDGHDVVGIREHRVFMRPSGRPLCQITMFKPPETAGQPLAMAEAPVEQMSPPPGTGTPAGGLSEDELSQGITQVSDTQYNVARSLLDKVLSNQSELMRAARIIPYEENGRVIGVKVYGIRRSSLLGRLGVQNGDVLRTINGFDLSSPDSALEAYTKLREMDQFTIAMVRRGQPRNMDYSVK